MNVTFFPQENLSTPAVPSHRHMKITIVGGGAHRVLGILRGALALPGVLDHGQIELYDLSPDRAEAMGRMLMKTPEFARAGCQVSWGKTLEESLEGADVVGLILPANSARTFALSEEASLRHGFISSDNLSPTGAMCAVRVAPAVMNVARKMERHCPNALLANFVNPVAVLSGMVSNHAGIESLGVCQGFTNHLWDISRLFGRDEEARSLEVESAGVNHLAFITRGTWQDEDLFEALQRRLSSDWQPPELQPWWSEAGRKNIQRSVQRLVTFWNRLGVLIFSTEPDGMNHLRYEEAVAEARSEHRARSQEELAIHLQSLAATRADANKSFESLLAQDLDARFWEEQWKRDLRFRREDEDIFVRIFAAKAGVREFRLAASRVNQGAIAGIKDRHVVEYTQIISQTGIRPVGRFEVPDVVHGIVSGFAAHQTLLGDALASEDPRMLAHALLAYPMKPYSQSLRDLYRELFAIESGEIAPIYQRAAEYL